MTQKLVFEELNDRLFNLGSVNSISELQGLLCGKLSGGMSYTNSEWLTDALAFLELDYLQLDDEKNAVFDELLSETQREFTGVDHTFYPLLPDDAASLLRRTEELAAWCQGFLHGVGTSGIDGEAEMSSEAAEGMRDIAQISQVDLSDGSLADEGESAEGETAYTELLEYVRTLAMTLYAELSLPRAAKQSKAAAEKNEGVSSKTLH